MPEHPTLPPEPPRFRQTERRVAADCRPQVLDEQGRRVAAAGTAPLAEEDGFVG